jgi:hypothetical protein
MLKNIFALGLFSLIIISFGCSQKVINQNEEIIIYPRTVWNADEPK